MAPSNPAVSVDLDVLESQLKVWKAYEREHGKPYPFSPAIYTALSNIMLPSTEPDLDDRNYIGDLHEWLQKGGKGNSCKLEEEDMIEPSTGQKRYRAWYRIPGDQGRFPREGFGHGHGEAAPTFSQKKRARQFAAKQAMACLSGPSMSEDEEVKEEETGNDDYDYYANMNDNENHNTKGKGRDEVNGNGSYPRRPPTPQNYLGRKKIRIGDAEGQNGASIAPPAQASRSFEMPRSSNNANNYDSEDEEAEGATFFKRIEKKCKILGIDAPQYHIKLDTAGRWYGRPSLWADGRMPENMGVVRDVPSKAQAKVEMAEQVLAWLVGEEQNRKKDMDTMQGSRFTN